MSSLKRTPLYPLYAGYPAVRCIDFGGWELPVQFYGIQVEHDAVRERAGLFDVSHMGEFWVTGNYAELFLQRMTTNDVSQLAVGQAQYTLMCYPDGGVVDDLIIYKVSPDQFLLVVNASNIEKDFAWLNDHIIGDVALDNQSERTALLALQGPLASDILSRVTKDPIETLLPFNFLHQTEVCGRKAMVSRTGYTGEDGFEIFLDDEDALPVWSGLITAGESDGLVPVGLGARDTLRFEAKLPLYGQELSKDITPLEAGLGFFVKLGKENGFIGHEALIEQKAQVPRRKLVGLEMIDRGIPRAQYPVYADDRSIGVITSGTQSPTFKRNLGLALLDTDYTEVNTEVWVEIRGKRLKAIIVKTPFYKKTIHVKE